MALTGGVGWDFPIAQDLVFRPIFNFALGQVTSDLRLARFVFETSTGAEIDFLDQGHHNSYGLGGSLMLDYEMVRPDQEIDVELRYTAIRLQSFGGTSEAVKGQRRRHHGQPLHPLSGADRHDRARPAGALRARVRLSPATSATSLRSASTTCTPSAPAWSSTASAHDIFITRTRLVGRYRFGNNVSRLRRSAWRSASRA